MKRCTDMFEVAIKEALDEGVYGLLLALQDKEDRDNVTDVAVMEVLDKIGMCEVVWVTIAREEDVMC